MAVLFWLGLAAADVRGPRRRLRIGVLEASRSGAQRRADSTNGRLSSPTRTCRARRRNVDPIATNPPRPWLARARPRPPRDSVRRDASTRATIDPSSRCAADNVARRWLRCAKHGSVAAAVSARVERRPPFSSRRRQRRRRQPGPRRRDSVGSPPAGRPERVDHRRRLDVGRLTAHRPSARPRRVPGSDGPVSTDRRAGHVDAPIELGQAGTIGGQLGITPPIRLSCRSEVERSTVTSITSDRSSARQPPASRRCASTARPARSRPRRSARRRARRQLRRHAEQGPRCRSEPRRDQASDGHALHARPVPLHRRGRQLTVDSPAKAAARRRRAWPDLPGSPSASRSLPSARGARDFTVPVEQSSGPISSSGRSAQKRSTTHRSRPPRSGLPSRLSTASRSSSAWNGSRPTGSPPASIGRTGRTPRRRSRSRLPLTTIRSSQAPNRSARAVGRTTATHGERVLHRVLGLGERCPQDAGEALGVIERVRAAAEEAASAEPASTGERRRPRRARTRVPWTARTVACRPSRRATGRKRSRPSAG